MSDYPTTLCFDEFGPINLKLEKGVNWAPMKRPDRIPANYRKNQGVQYLFACYDLKQDKLFGHIKQRKRWNEFLAFIKSVRKRYKGKLLVILDNYGSHKKAGVREYCENNGIEFVFTATNASWMNKIEGHFTPLRHFALNNSNYEAKKEQAQAIQAYLRWRNKNKKDKRILQLQNKNNLI